MSFDLYLVYLSFGAGYMPGLFFRDHRRIVFHSFPPQSEIALCFATLRSSALRSTSKNPPDIFGAVYALVNKIPAGSKEGAGALHHGCGFACPAAANASKGCTMQAVQVCSVSPESLAISHPLAYPP